MRIPGEARSIVIVGAGPAGLAPLFAAASAGRLRELLAVGVKIIEAGEEPGTGVLARCGISSDSTAEAFLDIVVRSEEPALQALRSHPLVERLRELGKAEAPLPLVAEFLRVASGVLCELVASSERGSVLTRTKAQSVQQNRDGSWTTRVRFLPTGEEHSFCSRSVVLATGAHQPIERLKRELVAGRPLLPKFGHKLLQSGDVLSHEGSSLVRERLAGRRSPRVAIVGGSTSAAAAAVRLLQYLPGVDFGEAGVTLLHRRPLRLCYESRERAWADGYRDFTNSDLCPLTGRVYRFSGFRLESRDLIRGALGVGGRAGDPRLALFDLLQERNGDAAKLLEGADLIVAAMGYRPRLAPVCDARSRPVLLHVPTSTDWSAVDARGQVRTWKGDALPGLFATGLSVGPVPDRDLGGEVGFRGQVNSLWMWQHTLGVRLVDELSKRAEEMPTSAEKRQTKFSSFFMLPPRLTMQSMAAAEKDRGGQ